MKWTTREGVEIEIEKMETLHLVNAIHYLEGRFLLGTKYGQPSNVPSSDEALETMAVLKLTPSRTIKESYTEMKRVLAERILEENRILEHNENMQKNMINLLEFL